MDNKTIELHTIATFQGKEYELENLLNGLLNKLEEKDKEIERLNNIIDELEKDLWKVRQLTFTKYNSNEWNNCLSFNDDILPIIKRIKALKEGKQ